MSEVPPPDQPATRTAIRAAADLAVLALAYLAAFLLRFDGEPPIQMYKRLAFSAPYVVGFQFFALQAFGVPRFAWSFVSLREALQIVRAVAVASVALAAVRILAALLVHTWGHAQYAVIPFGVIAGNTLLACMLLIGVRALRRMMTEHSAVRRRQQVQTVPTLLIGAGQAGALVAKEIAAHPDIPIVAVGFLDDDPNKHGLAIHGVHVLGPTRALPEVARNTGARQAVITMTGASGEVVRTILRLCDQAGIKAKVIPGIYQILDDRVNLSRIRDVSIEDLLGRDPVKLDTELLREFLRNKRVAITGAGGSIGSELCRQVAQFQPAELLLVEQAEYALFSIHQELVRDFPELQVVPIICDICDTDRVRDVFESYHPQVVFHAAAHKHVPMMEWNPGEAVKNNVFGTRNVADAADHVHADAFVLISTDKAVNPTSIMGATKRVAEMYVQSLSQVSATKYVAVRFGNVLGSTGSVIPIFKAQIAEGGPVTVTHPDMQRYFMTIPEASQLVMQAAAMGSSGQIFVLDMGKPVKIVDLARELIRLSGLEPDTDIAISYSGIRPGEKLFEEIGFDSEKMDRTRHEKIFVGRLSPYAVDDVRKRLAVLEPAASASSVDEVRKRLRAVVPEMQNGKQTLPASEPPSVTSVPDKTPAPALG